MILDDTCLYSLLCNEKNTKKIGSKRVLDWENVKKQGPAPSTHLELKLSFFPYADRTVIWRCCVSNIPQSGGAGHRWDLVNENLERSLEYHLAFSSFSNFEWQSRSNSTNRKQYSVIGTQHRPLILAASIKKKINNFWVERWRRWRWWWRWLQPLEQLMSLLPIIANVAVMAGEKEVDVSHWISYF